MATPTRRRASRGPKWSEWLHQRFAPLCEKGTEVHEWLVEQEAKGRTPQEIWRLAPQDYRDELRGSLEASNGESVEAVSDRLQELLNTGTDFDEILSASFKKTMEKLLTAEIKRLESFTRRDAPTLIRAGGEIEVRWA